VLIELEKKLPNRILSGREEIDEDDAQDDDSKLLKEALLSKEVDEFLAICEDEVAKGTLSTDLISKASVLHYYRIRFFPPDSSERSKEIAKSIEWLMRAMMIDPFDLEPQLKLAVVYGLSDEDEACISILERVGHDESSPQYLDQWLGFYLLFGDSREEDAIKHTLEFHRKFPGYNAASLLNLARAYAQMFKRKIGNDLGEVSQHAEYRAKALDYLKKGISFDPDLKIIAKKLAGPNGSFEAFANDTEFLEMVAPDEKGS
jgi:tetratricopeptide (TPR) repeat protein